MAASFTLPTVLANLAAGNQALSLIDSDLTTLRDPLLSLNTFSNYYTDVGAANAYAVTVSSPQTVSQVVGLRVQFLAANANTTASTFQINALAVKSIKNLNGSALSAGQIPASGLVDVMYDGTQYLLLNPAIPTLATVTNSLSADVAMNNTANYFTGPSCAQGAVGVWMAWGRVTVQDTAGAANIYAKLWDGTNVKDSAATSIPSATQFFTMALNGTFTTPPGNIRISVKDVTSTSGQILFNQSGNSLDSTLVVMRIA